MIDHTFTEYFTHSFGAFEQLSKNSVHQLTQFQQINRDCDHVCKHWTTRQSEGLFTSKNKLSHCFLEPACVNYELH